MIITDSDKIMYDSLLNQTDGIVELRAFKTGHRAGQRLASPMPNSSGWYKGIKPVSKEIEDSGKLYLDPRKEDDPFTNVKLYHGIQFDLSVETDKLMLAWILELPYVELNYNPIARTTDGYFYIYQKDQEFKQTAQRLNIKKEAFKLLDTCQDQELSSCMLLLQLNPYNMQPSEQRVTLEDHIDKEPGFGQRFINMLNDPQRKLKHTAAVLIDRQIVKISTHGDIVYGDIILAKSREQFVHWLSATERNPNDEYFEIYLDLIDKINNNKVVIEKPEPKKPFGRK